MKRKSLNKNAKTWVAALRSGKFRQAKCRLKQRTNSGRICGCCCLGVACRIFIRSGGKLSVVRKDGETDFEGNNNVLPVRVQEWLGLSSDTGEFGFGSEREQLSALNDTGKSFNDIADIIESMPEGLFE